MKPVRVPPDVLPEAVALEYNDTVIEVTPELGLTVTADVATPFCAVDANVDAVFKAAIPAAEVIVPPVT